MHARIASTSRATLVAVELGGVGEGRQPGPVADLVGEAPAEPGDDVLVAQEPVQAHRVGRAAAAASVAGVDGVGLGAEPVERRLRLGVAGDDPHAGLALGAGLGEQQRPPVGEAPAGLADRAAWPTASRRA